MRFLPHYCVLVGLCVLLMLAPRAVHAFEIHVFPDLPLEQPSHDEAFRRVLLKELNETQQARVVQGQRHLSRLEMAQRLLLNFDVPVHWVLQETSPFRDVRIDDPHYATIECAWQHRILRPDAQYRLHMEAPATQLDVWLALRELLLTSISVKDTYNLTLLQQDPSIAPLPLETQEALTVLYEHYILDLFLHLPLNPSGGVTPEWLEALLRQVDHAQTLLTNDVHRGLSDAGLRLISKLPGGVPLSFTPQQTIVGHALRAGQPLYFSLKHPIYPPNETGALVEGSTLTGQVTTITYRLDEPNIADVNVQLSTIRNGHSNAIWRVRGQLVFAINRSSVDEVRRLNQENQIQNFILPTQQFDIVSQSI